jgi:sugar lactone lactonase YvrE
MSNNLHLRIEKQNSRVLCGILAATLLAAPLHAQFVSTLFSSGLRQPDSIAVDNSGNLYVTDSGNQQIVAYSTSSGIGNALAVGFSEPLGIVAARGGLVVVDQGNQLIDQVTFDGVVTPLAGMAGVIGASNSANPTNATFSYPVGIAIDASSNLYIADWGNNLIREIDTNNAVTTFPTGAYQFNGPTALTVDNNSNLWVADTDNEVVCMVSNGVVTVMAGVSGHAGTNDSTVATKAHLNKPSGLLWDTPNNRLLIADSGNGSIRRLYFSNSVYGIETIAGITGDPGNVDGALGTAQFGYPVGICVDTVDFGFYIADFGNSSVRVLQPSAPQPPVSAPEIGYCIYPNTANPAYTSVFISTTGAVFNNLTNIVISAESGTETFVTYGPTGSAIPQPGPNSHQPAIYPGDGSSLPNVTAAALAFGAGTNDITIYAIGAAPGRRSSSVTSARIQFITANPIITGDNAASILLSDYTAGAIIYYTTNGMAPTNDGTDIGVGSGTVLSFDITGNLTLEARAFAASPTGQQTLATSQTVSNTFSISNLVGNQLTWGFAGGLASTHYITGLNMSFSAPVTFTELTGSLPIFTAQFDLTVTNNGASPAPVLTTNSFTSLLLQADPTPPDFAPLPTGIYDVLNATTNFGITATQVDTLGIAWLVSPPVKNMYHDAQGSYPLFEFSYVDQTLFTLGGDGGLAVVGALQFIIPPGTTPGFPFTLIIGYPSASSFAFPDVGGLPINVFVQAPTTGPVTNPFPNGVKLVTVLPNNSPESAHLVGDVFPYTWYNIGDFGDGYLLDDDVIYTMEVAWALAGGAYPADSPLYNAMDSSDGTVNSFFGSPDSAIDLIANGDGFIDVSDVYVTLRRSLDPSLVNYQRTWSGTTWVPSVYTNSALLPQGSPAPLPKPGKLDNGGPHHITVGADQVQTGGSLTAQVPVRVLAADTLPVRVLMFNVTIEPLDGSPAILTSAAFLPVTNLDAATFSESTGPNNYGGAWLDSTVSGVSGTGVIGTLSVTLPSNVTTNSAYRVHFNEFSASPNGLATFQSTLQDGLITVGDRSGSSWNDGIPDSWRLFYFGTVSNPLSAANADPDGDGANNWQEYVAGTNPLDATSVFQFGTAVPPAGGYFTLQWPSVVNKNYTVQWAPSLSGAWTTAASNIIGNSQVLQWTDPTPVSNARFYRAQVQ